jgi:competence protein ComGC
MSKFNKPLNDGLRDAAAAYAQTRSSGVVLAIKTAMATIDAEMADHDNIYPHNSGKLNQRELCRRAGVHFMTLQSPAHKETTRKQVDAWIESKSSVTKTAATKAVTDRAAYWKEQHRLVATQIHVYELEHKEKDLVIEQLRDENSKLREQLSKASKNKILNIVTKPSKEK